MINNVNIAIKSDWGVELSNRLFSHSGGSKKLVVIFPAKYYRCDAPLLYYSREAMLLSGYDVLSLNYGFQLANQDFKAVDMPTIAKEAFEVIQLCLGKEYNEICFIAKSLGTVIAGEVGKMMDHDKLKMIFMTPLGKSLAYLKNSDHYPCLIITGSRDHLFDDEEIAVAKKLSNVKLEVIDGANHSLEIEDDYKKSLQILNEVLDLCVSFIV